jgi:hypothetical protein
LLWWYAGAGVRDGDQSIVAGVLRAHRSGHRAW